MQKVNNNVSSTNRLQALKEFDILDTLPEEEYEDIITLVKCICKTPIVLISFIDETRNWFKAKVGIDADHSPSEISFCRHTILQNGIFEVEDTLKDDRFATNPMVTGDLNIRFYAGYPISVGEGYNLGSLCVGDTSPNKLTDEQKNALIALAKQVANQLYLRKKTKEINHLNTQLTENLEYSELLQKSMLNFNASENLLRESFKNFETLNLPKAKVSGDFFVSIKVKNNLFLLLVDCAGHGVSAGLSSIAYFSTINRIIINESITDIEKIAHRINELSHDYQNLRTKKLNNSSAMTIVKMDFELKKIDCLGIQQSILIKTKTGEIVNIKFNSTPLNYDLKNATYTKQTYNFDEITRMVLYTDGIIDQKGGSENKKLGTQNFINWVSEKTSANNYYTNKLKNWMGSNDEQIDDILILDLTI